MYKVFYKSSEIIFQNKPPSDVTTYNEHLLLYPDMNQIIQAINICFLQNTSIHRLYIVCHHPQQTLHQLVQSFYHIQAAGGVVVNEHNEVLLIKRAGVWDLPKGKIDPDEKTEDAAVREVKEETGVESVSIIKQLQPSYHIYSIENDWIFKTTHWFFMLATKSQLKPQIEEKITEARWIELDNIAMYTPQMYPSLLPVLKNAGILK